jgi:hypothetical protein
MRLTSGVVNDRCAGVDRPIDRAALHAVFRVGHGVLVGALGDRDALHAHRIAGRVHHDEHVLQAAVLLPDEVADGTAVVAVLQHGGWRGLDAHLVLDAHAVHVVALAERAVLADHEFRHHEQADALHALGRAGHAGQHEVHDVLGHVVLTVGDEDLGAEHLVGTVGLRLGAAAHHGQVAAGLRLGEVHRAGPLAAHELLEIHRLELVGAGREQCLDGAVAQERAQREAHVGRVEHLAAGRADGLREALAAEVRRMLKPLPAARDVLRESILEARRGGDFTALERRGIAVAFDVQRRDHVLVEAGALLEHGLRGFQACVLEARQLGDLADVGQVLDVEQHVLEGGGVAHVSCLQIQRIRKGHRERCPPAQCSDAIRAPSPARARPRTGRPPGRSRPPRRSAPLRPC